MTKTILTGLILGNQYRIPDHVVYILTYFLGSLFPRSSLEEADCPLVRLSFLSDLVKNIFPCVYMESYIGAAWTT